MKTTKINLSNLRNDEHFQYHSEFKALIEKYGPEILKVTEKYGVYKPLFDDENEALVVVRKSEYAQAIEESNKLRKSIYRGFSNAIKSALDHFDAAKKAAAMRIKLLLDQLGKMSDKSGNEKSTTMIKLVEELQGPYAADVAILALGEWVTQLDTHNKSYISNNKERFSEDAEKTEINLGDARKELDKAYRSICEHIDAYIVINGPGVHEQFLRELNSRADKYNDILAQRKGRSKKNNKKNGKDTNSSPETDKK
jgi:hypothetical protein